MVVLTSENGRVANITRWLAGVIAGLALALVGIRTTMAEDSAIILHVFGPELPFMFRVTGEPRQFAWSEITASGDAGVGTITKGAGEVIGFDGAFYIADSDNPTPRPVSDEMTPTGAVIMFTPENSLTVESVASLGDLQDALDKAFVDTDTFVYVFKARAILKSAEYQLAGPQKPSETVIDGIKSGASQKAVTTGTPKYTVRNVAATMVGIRAPAYLNTVFEVPYHIHFLADDKSTLGHVTALAASNIEVEWSRADALNIRYWDTE